MRTKILKRSVKIIPKYLWRIETNNLLRSLHKSLQDRSLLYPKTSHKLHDNE